MRTGTETVNPCTCYHFGNSENVKNIHRGVLFSVKLNNETCDFTKRTLLHVFFSRFLNRTTGTKTCKVSCIYMTKIILKKNAFY